MPLRSFFNSCCSFLKQKLYGTDDMCINKTGQPGFFPFAEKKQNSNSTYYFNVVFFSLPAVSKYHHDDNQEERKVGLLWVAKIMCED